jgi:hypothetical protein
MNDTTNTTQAEITRLSNALNTLNTALATEVTNRTTAEQKQKKQISDLTNTMMDYERASSKILEYFVRLDARYDNLILILQETMNDFNEFLKLPEKSNEMMRYWEVAWAALNTVLPMLRINPGWVKLEQLAQTELKNANYALQNVNLQTKLLTLASRGHNVVDWISKENTLFARIRDLKSRPKSARTPIKALMAESEVAHKALESVIESTWGEYKVRMTYILAEQPFAATETLEQMVVRKLPELNYMTEAEIAQVGRSYLWEICRSWAPHNVALVTTRYRTGDGGLLIEGLNDTQQDKIMEWFGLQSNWAGGKVPVFPNLYLILSFWGVPRKTKSSGGSIFGFG